MMTWTVEFKGRNNKLGYAVVTAENVEMAIIWLEKALAFNNLPQNIKPAQLVSMVTSTRKVRILTGAEE